MAGEQRKLYRYFHDGKWMFSIGYVAHFKAHPPLELHEHGSMTEFVYMERGSQTYQTMQESFVVKQGEVFFTYPNELHDTGSLPEEISTLYYLIVDLEMVSELNVFTFPAEYDRVKARFGHDGERIFKASAELPGALRQLLYCFDGAGDVHFDTHVRNALSEVLIALTTPFTPKEKYASLSFERSIRYIEEHLAEEIRVTDLPHLDNMSLSTYNKYFAQIFGCPPGEFILKRKIEKTKELLSETELSVTEIAYRYGFSSSQYFATVFKRFCYVTPLQYRKNSRRDLHFPEIVL